MFSIDICVDNSKDISHSEFLLLHHLSRGRQLCMAQVMQ